MLWSELLKNRSIRKIPSNLKLLKEDAILLTEVFGKHEVNRIHLNFSDPWPKKRHTKRRLTSPAFLDVYQNILIDNGELILKTDNRSYLNIHWFLFKTLDFILKMFVWIYIIVRDMKIIFKLNMKENFLHLDLYIK